MYQRLDRISQSIKLDTQRFLQRCVTRFENPWQFRESSVTIQIEKWLKTEYCVISLPTLSHP